MRSRREYWICIYVSLILSFNQRTPRRHRHANLINDYLCDGVWCKQTLFVIHNRFSYVCVCVRRSLNAAESYFSVFISNVHLFHVRKEKCKKIAACYHEFSRCLTCTIIFFCRIIPILSLKCVFWLIMCVCVCVCM